MRNLIYFAALLLLYSCVGSTETEVVEAPDFEQWRGANRDGIYTDSCLLKKWPEGGPGLLWSVDSIGNGYGSPVITSDRVYVNGEIDSLGYLFAFDLKGKLLWKSEYGKEWTENYGGARSTPTVIGNQIYVCSGLGAIVCFEKTGERLWSKYMIRELHGKNNRFGYSQSLLTNDSVVYAAPGGADTNIIALNRFTGSIIWVSSAKGEISAYCSPLLLELKTRKIIVTFSEHELLGIDAATGVLLWNHTQDTICDIHGNTPFYDNGYIYYFAGCGNGCVKLKLSANGDSISEVWRVSSPSNYIGGMVKIGNKLFTSCEYSRNIKVLDANTGEMLDSLGVSGGPIIYADGMLYHYSGKGEMCLINPSSDSLELVSSFKIQKGTMEHFAHQVIKDGILYVRHGSSLMAYDINSKQVVQKALETTN